MAITLDTASAWQHGSSISTLAWSHTVSGSNRFLVVSVTMNQFPRPTVSSITFGSDNLALLQAQNDSGSYGRTEVWGVKNPTIQTATITVTISTATDMGAGSSSWTGVDQTTPVEATATLNDSTGGSNQNVTVTTLTNGAVVIDCCDGNNNASATIGASQTALQIYSVFVAGSLASSYQTQAIAGNTTNSWTWGGSATGWSSVGIALKPSGGGGGSIPKQLSALGVG